MMYEIEEWPKRCPKCGRDGNIIQSYDTKDNFRRRVRECTNCHKRYVTNTPKDKRFI